jgi:hypothetical protein
MARASSTLAIPGRGRDGQARHGCRGRSWAAALFSLPKQHPKLVGELEVPEWLPLGRCARRPAISITEMTAAQASGVSRPMTSSVPAPISVTTLIHACSVPYRRPSPENQRASSLRPVSSSLRRARDLHDDCERPAVAGSLLGWVQRSKVIARSSNLTNCVKGHAGHFNRCLEGCCRGRVAGGRSAGCFRAKARTDKPSVRESRRIAANSSTLDFGATSAPSRWAPRSSIPRIPGGAQLTHPPPPHHGWGQSRPTGAAGTHPPSQAGRLRRCCRSGGQRSAG